MTATSTPPPLLGALVVGDSITCLDATSKPVSATIEDIRGDGLDAVLHLRFPAENEVIALPLLSPRLLLHTAVPSTDAMHLYAAAASVGDGYTFSTVRGFSTAIVRQLRRTGRYYFELDVPTSYYQVGVVSSGFEADPSSGRGVGDDDLSWSYDGRRQVFFEQGVRVDVEGQDGFGSRPGDVVGVGIDLDGEGTLSYFLNGRLLRQVDSLRSLLVDAGEDDVALAPAVSLPGGHTILFRVFEAQMRHLPDGFQPWVADVLRLEQGGERILRWAANVRHLEKLTTVPVGVLEVMGTSTSCTRLLVYDSFMRVFGDGAEPPAPLAVETVAAFVQREGCLPEWALQQEDGGLSFTCTHVPIQVPSAEVQAEADHFRTLLAQLEEALVSNHAAYETAKSSGELSEVGALAIERERLEQEINKMRAKAEAAADVAFVRPCVSKHLLLPPGALVTFTGELTVCADHRSVLRITASTSDCVLLRWIPTQPVTIETVEHPVQVFATVPFKPT